MPSDQPHSPNINNSPDRIEQTRIKKDTPYSWSICFGSFLVYFICFGILNCFGVLLGPISEEYGTSNAATGWIGSLALGLNFASSALTSALYESFGIWIITALGIFLSSISLFTSSYAPNITILYITYGIGLGLGTSLLSLPAIVLLRVYFEKRLSLANGIVASGSVLGTVTLSPALAILIKSLGLRWALRILALVTLALSILLCLYKTKHVPYYRNKSALLRSLTGQFSNKVLWSNASFKAFLFSICIFFTGHLIPFIYLIDIAEHFGENSLKASLVLCYLSSVSAFGRIFFGLILSMCNLSVRKVFFLSLVSMGTLHLFVPLIHSYMWLCIYASVFGFFEGCFVSQFPVVVCQLVGAENAATALGITFTIMAIPMVSGPPLAGRIFDLTKSYDIAFFMAGTTSVLGGFLFHFAVCIGDREEKTCDEDPLLHIEPINSFFTRSYDYRKNPTTDKISVFKNDHHHEPATLATSL